MEGYRKVEQVKISIGVEPKWEEISFSELNKSSVFRLTDLDDNSKGSVNSYEDGKTVRIAVSDVYYKDGTYAIEAENYEGDEDEVLKSNIL